jgi:hypothetical protein
MHIKPFEISPDATGYDSLVGRVWMPIFAIRLLLALALLLIFGAFGLYRLLTLIGN